MRLTHLSLTHFRNFSRLDIDIPGGPVLLVGGNAQGKTSLLEAIYYLAAFTSFHASHDRQLISFWAQNEPLVVSRIVAEFDYSTANSSREARQRLEVRLISEQDEFGNSRLRKEILLNGVSRKVSDAMGAFNAVLFLPHMLRIVEGAPEERRRYLNLSLSQVIPGYASDLTEYNRVLSQRNALLKQLNERNGDADQLTFWDEQLAAIGARIIYFRIQVIHEIEKLAAQVLHDLTRGQEVLRLNYLPAFDPMPVSPLQYALPLDAPIDRSGQTVDQIRRGFQERLERIRAEEIQRGSTSIGPHRDDLRFLSNGIDLGIYGSRGQCRTAVLALKLAEITWMTNKTSHAPVLLLDEVLAELDPARRDDLLGRLMVSEQAMLTTTDLDLFKPSFISGAHIWQISAGQVQAQPVMGA